MYYPGRLHLHSGSLFGTREHPDTGEVGTAEFFVEASMGGQEPETFKLTAMDLRDYAAWCMEHDIDVEGGHDMERLPVYPFPVTDERLAAGGLVRYVETTYLDREKPAAINQIRQFLDGPL